jgi:hypothetical protein
MDRRSFVISTLVLTLAEIAQSRAAETAVPSDKDLAETLQDDVQFERMVLAVWTLFDILSLKQEKPVPQDDMEAFRKTQRQVREKRGPAAELVASGAAKLELPDDVIKSADALLQTLDEFGVRKDSTLAGVLVRSYFLFNKTLIAAGAVPETLCSIYPFRVLCGKA